MACVRLDPTYANEARKKPADKDSPLTPRGGGGGGGGLKVHLTPKFFFT